jgi:hypothetical protein
MSMKILVSINVMANVNSKLTENGDEVMKWPMAETMK